MCLVHIFEAFIIPDKSTALVFRFSILFMRKSTRKEIFNFVWKSASLPGCSMQGIQYLPFESYEFVQHALREIWRLRLFSYLLRALDILKEFLWLKRQILNALPRVSRQRCTFSCKNLAFLFVFFWEIKSKIKKTNAVRLSGMIKASKIFICT